MQLTVLTERQISAIHDASLEILQTIGVRVPHTEMRKLFSAAGAQVNAHSGIGKDSRTAGDAMSGACWQDLYTLRSR